MLSIQFSTKTFLKATKFLFVILIKLFSSKSKAKKESLVIKTNLENNTFQNIKTRTDQPNLPFNNEKIINKKKFKLPPIEYLKKAIKKNFENKDLVNDNNSEFLEKILLDFGVEGKIKKISHGPVVTLNEFEPAPGIRVSKIINLSDDIARNTSSLSTRVAIIPGKNTIGIEIPNQTEMMFF